jgi:hypothetical protein
MLMFQDSIKLVAAGQNLWSGEVDPAYRGFGSQFGGWTAAALLKAILTEGEAKGAPLSESVLFIEAVNEGTFEISTRLIRSGARLQFWRSELHQGGKCCAHAQVTLGVRRETTSFTDAVMPDVPPPRPRASASGRRRQDSVTQYRSRWVTPLPRSPGLDMQQAGEFAGVAAGSRWAPARHVWQLAALADLAPPRVMWKREATVSASSTVSMTTHFHATPEEIAAVGSTPRSQRGALPPLRGRVLRSRAEAVVARWRAARDQRAGCGVPGLGPAMAC